VETVEAVDYAEREATGDLSGSRITGGSRWPARGAPAGYGIRTSLGAAALGPCGVGIRPVACV